MLNTTFDKEKSDYSSVTETKPLSKANTEHIANTSITPKVREHNRVNTLAMPSVIRRMRENTEAAIGCNAKCDITIMRAAGLNCVSAGLYVLTQIGETVSYSELD